MTDGTVFRLRWAPLVGAALAGCVIGAALTALVTAPGGAGLAAPAYARAIAPESQSAIVEAIKQVGPAVVNINTIMQAPAPPVPEVFQPFFEGPFPRQGQASGVIIDQKGLVLTNNHVLEGATAVKVTLADGRTYDATVVGTDPLSDIGVVRIAVADGGLPFAELGASEEKPIGSWIIAIGNPYGYENTVTVGVLSARDRSLRAPNGVVLDHLLQTDAAINPGNSGGALVDIEGKVIGVPTAIIPYAQGIGFAISAESARKVATQLIATGRAIHPWLGVGVVPITDEIRQQIKLPDRGGVLVSGVEPDSPAAQAGIQPRDVIVRAGERAVTDLQVVADVVRDSTVGQELPLTILRNGTQIVVTVTVGKRPAPQPGAKQP
jgi:serine protease Do